MTEDVLEQVVDDWLRRKGYFTRTNVRFGPAKHDIGYVSRDHNQMSDLDVLAVSAVFAVSCKAMQEGFSPNGWLAAAESGRRYNGRGKGAAWKHLRELWDPVWAASLRAKVEELTGATRFTYVLAVTRWDLGEVPTWASFAITPALDRTLEATRASSGPSRACGPSSARTSASRSSRRTSVGSPSYSRRHRPTRSPAERH